MSGRENGHTREEINRERDRQMAREVAASRASQPDDGFEETKDDYLDDLTDLGMTDAGTDLLDNMIAKDWVLGNITDAEKNEIKWRLHTMYLRIRSAFPPRESDIQGKYRAFIFDDPDENLEALTDQQEIIITQALIALGTVTVSRSHDGFQQDKFVESITVSEVRNPEEADDDLIGGLFS